MGAIFSMCGLTQLACCCSSAAFSALSCCTPTNSPRIMYVLLLFLATLAGWIMSLGSVSDWLKSYVPFCWNSMLPPQTQSVTKALQDSANQAVDWLSKTTGSDLSSLTVGGKNATSTVCDELTGYLAVYRLMFAVTIFFFVFGLIMIKVRSGRDPRVTLHKGLWGIKFLLLIGGIVGAFFIPATNAFSTVWQNFGFVGAFIFLFIQFLLVIVFADEMANYYVRRMEDNEKWAYCALVFWSMANYLATIVATILFYVYYTGTNCGLHKFFISVNFVIVIFLSILAILPKIQEFNPRSGLLQSSMVTLYITYLTWSALSSSPHLDCKPEILPSHGDVSMNLQSFISMLICFIFIIYSAIRLSSPAQINRLSGTDANDANEEEDEEDRSNWSFTYFTYGLATLYLMMTLTNWYNPDQTYKRFGESQSSLWIKMTSTWLCAFIYLWTLIAPIILHDYRDFDFN